MSEPLNPIERAVGYPPRLEAPTNARNPTGSPQSSLNTPTVELSNNMPDLLQTFSPDQDLMSWVLEPQQTIEQLKPDTDSAPMKSELEPLGAEDSFLTLDPNDINTLELNLDVVQAAPQSCVQAMDSTWDLSACVTPQVSDPMTCVNPCDVEGLAEPTILATSENDILNAEVELVPSPPKRLMTEKNKLNLTLQMPNTIVKEEPAQEQPGLDTAAINQVLEMEAQQSDFDLLAFVTNKELPVNDPSFISLVNDVSTPEFQSQFGNLEAEAGPSGAQEAPKGKRIAKKDANAKPKRRGRPPTATVTSATADHAYVPKSNMSETEVEEKKYRRMRDLNNAASKRCRQNRKRKFETLLDSEGELVERNKELRVKCKQLEGLVKQLKAKFIEKVANPNKKPLDLDQLMAQRLMSLE